MPKGKTVKKPKKEIKKKPKAEKKDRYFEAIGRRKTAIARVRLYPAGDGSILVNEKPLEKYFDILNLQKTAVSPLEKMADLGKFSVTAKVKGGGITAQAEAVRHGISKALTLFDPESRKTLKHAGYLTRDPRMRERKKFGLKRARRAPQWSKR